MKVPTKCPICGDALLNNFNYANNNILKTCDKRLTHNIKFVVKNDNRVEKLWSISILLTEELMCIWYPELSKFVYVSLSTDKGQFSLETTIPYFEPDFSNFKKLKEKLKTYLIFT